MAIVTQPSHIRVCLYKWQSTVQFSSAYTLTADAQFFFGEYYYYSRIRWLLVFHHCSHYTHSKWIGNKSNVGENMFCMRFDVVCFWWQKQKYCFFTTHPTHFVNRYCALVVAAAVADGAVRFVVGSFFSVRVCVSFFRSFPLKNPFCVKRRTRWNGVYGRRCCLCTIYT